MRDDLLVIGVMTGNSMDAADAVLTRFSRKGDIEDLKIHEIPIEKGLFDALFDLRTAVNKAHGDMFAIAKNYVYATNGEERSFQDIHDDYVRLVARVINELVEEARRDPKLVARFGENFRVDLVGNHGQNVAHRPPSIAGSKDLDSVYTVQIGDGQMLADLTGIPVVFDFRSDDVMNGGEGAPLAPMHQKALSNYAKAKNCFPLVFCNAGNTGNVSVITNNKLTGALEVMGWDTGPFNYFVDQLARRQKDCLCDMDGLFAKSGQVNIDLLRLLFETCVVDHKGTNYLLDSPPKSSDGEWYKLLSELMGEAPINGQVLSFEDRMRTACYFSAYVYMHSLSLIPDTLILPKHYALCGGGWKNPVAKMHFEALVKGDENVSPVLREHKKQFAGARNRLNTESQAGDPTVFWSNDIGFDGTAMEARIFAHLAVCRLRHEPFTSPESTGCKRPSVCGILRFPESNAEKCSACLKVWMTDYKTVLDFTFDRPDIETRWGRASSGWHKRYFS